MNLLEMFKKLTDEEKQEFIKLIIQELNKKTANNSNLKIKF